MFECIKPEIHVYLTNDIEKENMKVFKLPDLGINDIDMYEEDV
jgi:hypothetical protein